MSFPKLPKWLWWIVCAAVILIVLALLKFDISVGSQGVHVQQHLIH
jgi:hypothetical protein